MLLMALLLGGIAAAADPSSRIVLPQGTLTGVRLQTERRVAVNAYLGIPYALPPLGAYRFSAPERHPGWNLTLSAEHFRPDCLQPGSNKGSEDCLYLNVFVPQGNALRDLPVVVFLEGEDYITGSPRKVAAQELAAEGVIVVTVSYRLNVFGFLCLGDYNSRGNMGLLDQYVALLWVRENAIHFGGRADVTLMGHGAGASAVVTHLTSPRTRGLFERAVVMSGSVFSPHLRRMDVLETSNAIARSLGCKLDQPQLPSNQSAILTCLRKKSTDEIMQAFDNFNTNANWTSLLVPIADDFLPDRMQYLPASPVAVLQSGQFPQIPILTGTTAREGSLILERWRDLESQLDSSVQHFITKAAIPNLLTPRALYGPEITALVTWRYLPAKSRPAISSLVQLYGDATIAAPHWQQVEALTKKSQGVFVYRFKPRGDDGARPGGHGSDLDFLFGPLHLSKWQSDGNKATYSDERLSLLIKRLWTTFFRTGDPNPGSANKSALWPPYTTESATYLELLSEPATGRTMEARRGSPDEETATFWNSLLPSISNISRAAAISGETAADIVTRLQEDCAPYRNALFTTLFFLILLIACLIIALYLLKRRTSSRQKSFMRQMPSVMPDSGPRHWRDNLASFKL